MAGWKNWKGPQVKILMANAAREAIADTGATILAAAQAEVPHRDGFLEKSGGVFMAQGDIAEGCVSFGGGPGTGKPEIPYARRWHENDANFQKGRKKRYLADPFNRLAATTLRANLAKKGKEKLI